jgi:hypothetical protein
MKNDLDRYVLEREAREPGLAALIEAAEQRRVFARAMAERRKKAGLSQAQVAAARTAFSGTCWRNCWR